MSRRWSQFVFTVAVLLAVPAVAQEGIHWQQDIEAAKATAKQTGRLVLVHFWTPSCGPCLMLDKNVFNQPGVASAVESQFVPVKLNANENSATATAFGITRVPTDVILTPDGQLVGKLISPPTPAAYVAEMSQVAAQFNTRAGQAFANAAAQAPVPSQLNSAYANLPIAPETVPATTAQLTANTSPAANAPSQDRAPLPAPTVATLLGGTEAIPAGSAQSVANNSFAPWSPTPQVPPATAAVPTNSVPSLPTMPAPVSNPYVQSAPVSAPPQNTYGASQVTNPYANSVAPMAPATAAPVAPPIAPPIAQSMTPPGARTVAPASATMPTATAPQQTIAGPASPPAVPNAQALPAGAPPLGFDGYCPVSMRSQWKWVAGDPRYGVVHLGRTYWFAGPNEQQQFLADPHRFGPALSGMDPVLAVDHRQQVPGKREHSIDYDNLFYMFASEATLQQFAANPERYSTSVRQAMGIPRGRLVR